MTTEVWFRNVDDNSDIIHKTLMETVPRVDEYVYLNEERFCVVEVEWFRIGGSSKTLGSVFVPTEGVWTMILHLANKNFMAFDKMIEEAGKRGGIPSWIELTPHEAIEVLQEINELIDILKSRVAIIQLDDGPDIRFSIWGNEPMDIETLKDLVQRWYKGDISIEYRDVELRVVQKREPAYHHEQDEG